jgi:hypothetical protein
MDTVRPAETSGRREPYWPQECVQLLGMVQRGEPAARIVERARWIAAGYARRPAHDAVAARHNRHMVELLTAVAETYRRADPRGGDTAGKRRKTVPRVGARTT